MSRDSGRRGRWGAVVIGLLVLTLPACRDRGEEAFVGSAPETTTTMPVTTSPPGTTAGSPTSTSTTVAVITTRRPTTTRPRGTTTTVANKVACSSAQLVVEATTTQPAYRPNETVRIQATVRNRSDRPCYYTSYGISTRIDDAAGQPVRPAPNLIVDAFEETVLEPGQTIGSTPTWDQQICSGSAAPCTQAPLGQYVARAIFVFAGAPVEGKATFELIAP